MRLEDVVAVTATGITNYTIAPRTCGEVETVMAGGVWPPVDARAVDEVRWWVCLCASVYVSIVVL